MRRAAFARALTPALAREQARGMGAMRMRAIGGCGCRGGSLGALGALPSVPDLPSVSAAQVRAALPANLQASWDAHVDAYNASAVQQQGAASALALASGHGTNSDAVHAFAAGVSFVPGAGPILAGAAEFFNTYGAQIGDAFGQLFGLIKCNAEFRTPAQWIQAAGIPAPKPGTFASVVVPMLALAYSDWANCHNGAHGLDWTHARSQIIPAAVGAWNLISQGPPIDYFVPDLNGTAEGMNLIDQMGTRTGTGMILYGNLQGPWAFGPLAGVPGSARYGAENMNWQRVSANKGPLLAAAPPKHLAFTLPKPPPKHIAFSTAHLTPSTAAGAKAPAPAGMSAGGKVAAAAAGAGGAALLWWLGSHRWKWVTPRWARRLVR